MQYQVKHSPIRVALAGTGFIARGFAELCRSRSDMVISSVLTRRDPKSLKDFPARLITRDPARALQDADVVVECTGDVLHAADIVAAAHSAGLPVVTMNAEFHNTCGSYFLRTGFVTEAEGDQPGCLASLHEEVVDMGFQPLVYGNVKGFLNHRPSPEEMQHWAHRNGISIDQVTSFTDGTKLQIEQAMVANAYGTGIARQGLLGPKSDTLADGAQELARYALELGYPISDYVLTRDCPGGVFIVATHDAPHAGALEYFKLGTGPFYTITRPRHLCYLEIPRSIRHAMAGRGTIDNSHAPTISVAAIAKRDIAAGEQLERGTGSFNVRGECVRMMNHPGHVPIGLVRHAVASRDIASGEILTMADVELPDSLALQAWQEIENEALDRALNRVECP